MSGFNLDLSLSWNNHNYCVAKSPACKLGYLFNEIECKKPGAPGRCSPNGSRKTLALPKRKENWSTKFSTKRSTKSAYNFLRYTYKFTAISLIARVWGEEPPSILLPPGCTSEVSYQSNMKSNLNSLASYSIITFSPFHRYYMASAHLMR